MAMDSSKHSLAKLALISFVLVIGAVYFCLFFRSKSNPLYSYHSCWHGSDSLLRTNVGTPVDDDLELALRKASMPNKTVIVAFVNRAYVDQSVDDDITMLDLFLESFWLGEDTKQLLDHLLLVTVDQTAYTRCMFKRLNCYRLATEDVNVDLGGEKVYMSHDFINLMWRRTQFLLEVFKRGYNFVFTDTDVMWLRNPFPKLSKETEDLQISVDSFNGDPQSEINPINTGFYYTKSNNKTISLFETWYNLKDNSTGKKEQDVLLDLMIRGFFRKLNLSVTFLPTNHFSGFCEDSKDIWSVTTVHSNCCRLISAKIKDLKAVHRDWKRFKVVSGKDPNFSSNESFSFRWTEHIGCWDSWRRPVSLNNSAT